MLGAILGVLSLFAAIAIVLSVAAQFPTLSKLWLAALIAIIVLAVIRALHTWFCGVLCG